MNSKQNLRGNLGSFVGEWTGRNELWLEPATPAHECGVDASVTAVARGACIAIRYGWEEGGTPHEGLLVVRNTTETGAEDMVWVDSFHTGGGFMRFRGEADDAGRVAALGSYPAPEGPDWGWRIVLGSDGTDELHLLMYNITPDGTAHRAVETRLTRRRVSLASA
jgi:hypothetical protein